MNCPNCSKVMVRDGLGAWKHKGRDVYWACIKSPCLNCGRELKMQMDGSWIHRGYVDLYSCDEPFKKNRLGERNSAKAVPDGYFLALIEKPRFVSVRTTKRSTYRGKTRKPQQKHGFPS